MAKRTRYTDALVVSTPAKAKSTKWRSKYRSRSSFYRPLSQVGSGFGRAYSTGFPKMLKMTHKYVSRILLVPDPDGITTFNYWYFSCNGMYGPEGTFAGHQPYYFDQLSALYDHYTVIGSKVKMTITNTHLEENHIRASQVATCINDAGTAINNLTLTSERPSGNLHVISGDGGAIQKVVRMSWSARKAFGSAAISDPNLQGTATSNPAEQQWFYIEVANGGPLTNTTPLDVTVEVQYIAVWQELKAVPIS